MDVQQTTCQESPSEPLVLLFKLFQKHLVMLLSAFTLSHWNSLIHLKSDVHKSDGPQVRCS